MQIALVIATIFCIDVLSIGLAVYLGGENPRQYFKEGKFITILSFLQLFLCSLISWKIFKKRGGIFTFSNVKSSYFIWAIISIGFLYLSLDEIALLHENIDKLIHYVLNLEETGLTDRIDDIILLLYGLSGIVILYYYKEEFIEQKGFIYLISVGFVFTFSEFFLDLLHNRNDVLPQILNPELLSTIKPWLEVTEGAFKLFAEAFFIAAFFSCYTSSKFK